MTATGRNEESAVPFTTLRQVKNYRGTVKAGVLAKDGLVYFEIAKKELIRRIEVSPGSFWHNFSIEYEPTHNCLYVDSARSE